MTDLPAGLRKDAELIIDVCFTVETGDIVTIICDNAHRTEADALAQIAVERGAFPVIMNNEEQVRRGLHDTQFPMDPPRNLHQAMLTSDEVIIVTNLEWANRFAHIKAVKETVNANQKIGSIEDGMGSWDLTEADIHEAIRRAQRAIEVLKGKKRMRVTTALGTDITVSIEGRPALQVTPIRERGMMMGPTPLWAEVAFAAVEDQSEGIVVVDGVMLGIGLPGQVKNPITWTMKGGHAVSIEGSTEAEKLKQVISGVENSDIIGEFAFGVSDKAPFGTPSEKGRAGTVHFALGDNHNAYPGGQNVCRLHLDGVCLKATMQIVDNGQYILKDGKWVL
ncbi:MAG: aminopeptidase [Anaerolineae bacterium]|nr:aminopeptidase [Anaerolineae bacterium]